MQPVFSNIARSRLVPINPPFNNTLGQGRRRQGDAGYPFPSSRDLGAYPLLFFGWNTVMFALGIAQHSVLTENIGDWDITDQNKFLLAMRNLRSGGSCLL